MPIDRHDRDGVVDIWWDAVESPVGALVIARTGAGVMAIGWQPDELLDRLAAHVSPRIRRAPNALVAEHRQLDEYFEGRRRRFEVEIDWTLVRGFRLEVLQELVAVPFGQVITYTELAARTGRPRAVRAVGSAMATNPLPIIVPCHRVLRTGGGLGGYSGAGGLETKRWLLVHEGVELDVG